MTGKNFKYFLVLVGVILGPDATFADSLWNRVSKINWIHGSTNCTVSRDPSIQVEALTPDTYILRQSKCVHYEAPFMYLFLGHQKAILFDTGATSDPHRFPIQETIATILEKRQKETGHALTLVVAHTHGHGDHVAGDAQFSGKSNTVIVGKKVEEVIQFFDFKNWPEQNVEFDLGGRILDLIPLPGHEASHIAIYDRLTGLLLTGDTFYPGHLFVFDWAAYIKSLGRLLAFAETHRVSALMGAHIEMTKTPFVAYEYPTLYQPNEHALPLSVKQLKNGYQALTAFAQPDSKLFEDFIISNQTLGD